MSSPLFTVRATESAGLATERLEKARVTGLAVVDEEWPVGVFTQTEARVGSMDVRRIVTTRDDRPEGIVTGLDFARTVA